MADKISLGYLTYGESDPVKVAIAAAKAGFDEVGVRLLPSGPDQVFPLLGRDKSARKDFAKCLADHDMCVGDIELVRLNDNNEFSELEQFFEIAAELGGRHVLAAGDDPDASRLMDSFAKLCQTARGYGMTIDLEFMPWTPVRDVNAAKAIVDASEQDNAGILIDALHFQKSGSKPGDIQALPANMLHYVQLCDGPADYQTDDAAMLHAARHARLLPGDGEIDLVEIVRLMPPDFTFSVEVPNDSLFARHGLQSYLQLAHDAAAAVLKAANR